jgi:hypothetical protein
MTFHTGNHEGRQLRRLYREGGGASSPMWVMFSPGGRGQNTQYRNLFASESHEVKKKEGRTGSKAAFGRSRGGTRETSSGPKRRDVLKYKYRKTQSDYLGKNFVMLRRACTRTRDSTTYSDAGCLGMARERSESCAAMMHVRVRVVPLPASRPGAGEAARGRYVCAAELGFAVIGQRLFVCVSWRWRMIADVSAFLLAPGVTSSTFHLWDETSRLIALMSDPEDLEEEFFRFV